MESPIVKKSVRPKIRTPFSPKNAPNRLSPTAMRRPGNATLLTYSPQPRIFNSRKKMSAELQMLQDRIASAEKAKNVLSQANQRLHLEFRTLSEELAMESAMIAKRTEKLASKSKHFRLETGRMKTRMVELESDLEEAAKSRWRGRMDSRNF